MGLKEDRTFNGKRYKKGSQTYNNKHEVEGGKEYLKSVGWLVRAVPFKVNGKTKYKIYKRRK